MPDLSYTAFGVGAGGHAAIMWIDRDTQGDPAKLRLASFH
jgi:hypothetical protein